MRVGFRESFERDLLALRNPLLNRQVKKLIEKLETARSMLDLRNVKKLAGGDNYYRIRIGDYRVGVVLDGSAVTLVRILHRRDIYRHFP